MFFGFLVILAVPITLGANIPYSASGISSSSVADGSSALNVFGGSSGNSGSSGGSFGSEGASFGSEGGSFESGGGSFGSEGGSFGSEGGNFGSSVSAGGDGGGGYGSSRVTKCQPYYETVFDDRCEQYNERVCTTIHQESCRDVTADNCKAVVSSRQVRKCFNVTELLCSLKEEVRYDTVQATFTVQKCQKIPERVCDTVYETLFTAKDDYKCLKLDMVQCFPDENVLTERTCKTVTNFDCRSTEKSYGGYGSSTVDSSGGYGTDGGSSFNSGDSGFGSSGKGPFGGSGNGPFGGSAGGSYGGSDYSSGYQQPTESCKRKVETKCYDTPRRVAVERCEAKNEKSCEKLAERVPYPMERQHCHNEFKKVCELEKRVQPKQVKKYVYSKHCRPMVRTICENMDVKELVPSCIPQSHKKCEFSPVDKCSDIPKEHCYKVSRRVTKQKCTSHEVPSGYGGDKNSYSGGSSF